MTKIDTLIRKRNVIKSKLNTFTKFLTEAEKTLVESGDEKTLAIVLSELQERSNNLDSIFKDFDEIQIKIEENSDNFDAELVERELFENDYYKELAACKHLLSTYQNERQEDNVSIASNVSARSNNNSKINIKLPQINLPTFNGTSENWLEFRDTFYSLIHYNDRICQIEKFHYLRAALQGGAAQVINSIEFSADNYKNAWDLLCERYNNTELLIRIHLKTLFELPIINKEAANELKTLVDQISKNLRALKILKEPTEHWDTIIIFLIITKLDKVTKREWEEHKKRIAKPQTLEEFKAFLRGRADLLETLESDRNENVIKNKIQTIRTKAFVGTLTKCAICNGFHPIFNCETFLKRTTKERYDSIRKLKLCINCLRPGHIARNCKLGTCKKCGGQHNTLLHEDRKQQIKDDTSNRPQVVLSSQMNTEPCRQILLATALIEVMDINGKWNICRAILDSGSQSNFITHATCKKLGVQMKNTEGTVVGINQLTSKITNKCQIKIKSRHNAYETITDCLVLKELTDEVPSEEINKQTLNIPQNIKLADPSYYKPGKIDLLIGAGLFWTLICIGRHELGPGLPILQKTLFGWILTGTISKIHAPRKVTCNFSKNIDIQENLQKFWEIEEWANKVRSKEDDDCEKMFSDTIDRSEDGRFIVTIPFKESITLLGDSKHNAMKRLHSLESKFQKNQAFKTRYQQFILEYEELGHMSEINEDTEKIYYLPHHGVINEQSLTTKLRVVFDGSSPTSSGWSLNDLQYAGPVLQEDLVDILLRFRQHTYVVSADVCKMYRQIWVTPSQRKFQAILWRKEPEHKIKSYVLNTVTYGTKSAPYLAIRCLKELANINASTYPEASQAISSDFYVDDLLTGSDSISECIRITNDIIKILNTVKFELRKWVSNNQNILQKINVDVSPEVIIKIGEGEKMKTLGINWISTKDVLTFNVDETKYSATISKRKILSEISQIFDPLGFLSPCVLVAKIILQKLWLYKLSWDEAIPQNIHSTWKTFREQMPDLNNFHIPRHVISSNAIAVQLHGFADASQEAYGAVIYLRSTNAHDEVQVRLLIAKSKVAPLKAQSIPRLELCGALVLANLVTKVISALKIKIDSIFLWLDSTVSLHWINTEPSKLQPFVGNRVSQIQTLTCRETWRHVGTSNNPADLLTRGVSPKQLLNSSMWWYGPSWLMKNESEWQVSKLQFEKDPPELRKVNRTLLIQEKIHSFPFERYSRLIKLQRVMGYCLRFFDNCKKSFSQRITGDLTPDEIRMSTIRLVKLSQTEEFTNEIKALRQGKEVSKSSPLYQISPFIDSHGLIRVGGRLQQADLTIDKKHPWVLAKKHSLTFLILKNEHERLFHAGAQATLSSVREQYWPISGRNTMRKIIRSCIVCFKAKPQSTPPLMGALPRSRITPAPPFYNTGVDYAGPFWLKNKMGRGFRLTKAYICLFICMCTKAVHLELVSDLTKEAFIASFRRFASRRGQPSCMYSDNGKNFVAANKELKILLKQVKDELKIFTTGNGTDWKFIPVHAPHFGGLWESGIKGVKHHLKRVLGNLKLTYEQFLTIITQIEGILNSRPLTPLSTDPSDLQALTPAHFLIGRTITAPPDPDLCDILQNRLSKFQLLQQVQQHFWTRWKKEYLSELQLRVKWKSRGETLKVGTLVIIKEENLPPLCWHLGKIVKTYPGPDGICRVADINTSNGIIRRAFSKICTLPLAEDDNKDDE